MVVDASCGGSASRTFHILSESGSHALVNHVLKELLKTEREAALNQHENALTPANYVFTLLGTTSEVGHTL